MRVSLDSQLRSSHDDVAKLRQKLDIADGERRGLLSQGTKLTEMVEAKDKEVGINRAVARKGGGTLS